MANPLGNVGQNAMEAAEHQRNIAERKHWYHLRRVTAKIVSRISGMTDPQAAIREIERYANTEEFAKTVHNTARYMVNEAVDNPNTTWKTVLGGTPKARQIQSALRSRKTAPAIDAATDELIKRNEDLIRSIPKRMAERLREMIAKQGEDASPEEIMKQIEREAPDIVNGDLHRLARTETANAQAAVMEARCQSLGIKLYVWCTRQDERVRQSHYKMDGVVCKWDDPPNPERLAHEKHVYSAYHPGGIYNCRCVAIPVVDETAL